MATQVRRVEPHDAAWAALINALKAQLGAGSSFHLDASEITVSAANATDLASSLVLVNQLKHVYNGPKGSAPYPGHRLDTGSGLAHKVADTTNSISSADATDLASAITLANELKAEFNAHIASTTFHYTADATNTVATANASDQTTLNALVNQLKTSLNAHMASAPSAPSVRLISA